MKFNLFLAGMLMLLLTALPGVAQQPTVTDEPPAPTAQETVTPPSPPVQQRPNEQFVPTESISEDLSVPFPVDI